MTAQKPVSEGRMVAHLGHLDNVIRVDDLTEGYTRSHLAIKIKDVFQDRQISKIREVLGWNIVGIGDSGLVFLQPDSVI